MPRLLAKCISGHIASGKGVTIDTFGRQLYWLSTLPTRELDNHDRPTDIPPLLKPDRSSTLSFVSNNANNSERPNCGKLAQHIVAQAKMKGYSDKKIDSQNPANKHTVLASLEKRQVRKAEEKYSLWRRIKKEIQHYWDGTKLLGTEINISSKLALKMAAGYELSRRESRQLKRTVQDLARLVPFSVFIIVPFAELLLPVVLKIFPNMLPSTYEGQTAKDLRTSKLRKTRKDVSQFLRNTIKESGLPLSTSKRQSEEFTEFFRKVRTSGEAPSHNEVVNVCNIFKDDLTLDNLSRPQLVGMCRYMSLPTFGTDTMLRYSIRHKMRQTKRDDKAIIYEGVDSLSVSELQTACVSRGIRTHGRSPARMREDLSTWLDLRLQRGVPSTLLILSNAFMYGKDESELSDHYDALQAVLSSLPDELYHEAELEVHNAEGAATNKQRLEVIREQQELIQEENQQAEQAGEPQRNDHENLDDEAEEKRQIK